MDGLLLIHTCRPLARPRQAPPSHMPGRTCRLQAAPPQLKPSPLASPARAACLVQASPPWEFGLGCTCTCETPPTANPRKFDHPSPATSFESPWKPRAQIHQHHGHHHPFHHLVPLIHLLRSQPLARFIRFACKRMSPPSML